MSSSLLPQVSETSSDNCVLTKLCKDILTMQRREMKWKTEIEQLRAQEIKLRKKREFIEGKQKIWKKSIEKKELEKEWLMGDREAGDEEDEIDVNDEDDDDSVGSEMDY